MWAISPGWRRGARDDENLRVLMAAVVGPHSCAVDIGANRGDFTARMCELAPQAHHVALEPLPELAAKVAARCPAATVHEVAVTDKSGTATFTRAVGREGYSSLDGEQPEGAPIEEITVQVAPLDSLLEPGYSPDFVKIDVEGAELQVFRGARRTLREHHPIVWFEHGRDFGGLRQTHSSEIWDLLTGLGYRIFSADGDGPIDRRSFVGTPGDARMWNWIAR